MSEQTITLIPPEEAMEFVDLAKMVNATIWRMVEEYTEDKSRLIEKQEYVSLMTEEQIKKYGFFALQLVEIDGLLMIKLRYFVDYKVDPDGGYAIPIMSAPLYHLNLEWCNQHLGTVNTIASAFAMVILTHSKEHQKGA